MVLPRRCSRGNTSTIAKHYNSRPLSASKASRQVRSQGFVVSIRRRKSLAFLRTHGQWSASKIGGVACVEVVVTSRVCQFRWCAYISCRKAWAVAGTEEDSLEPLLVFHVCSSFLLKKYCGMVWCGTLWTDSRVSGLGHAH